MLNFLFQYEHIYCVGKNLSSISMCAYLTTEYHVPRWDSGGQSSDSPEGFGGVSLIVCSTFMSRMLWM